MSLPLVSLFDGVQILMARECRFQIYNSYLHIKKYLREYLMSKFIQLINRFINYHHSGCDTEGGGLGLPSGKMPLAGIILTLLHSD